MGNTLSEKRPDVEVDDVRTKTVMIRAMIGVTLTAWAGGCGELRVFRAPGPPREPPAQVAQAGEPVYHIGCPDVIRVKLTDRPDFDMLASVNVDGRLPLGESVGTVRVEGRTLVEARAAIATAAGTIPEQVQIKVEDARTARVYLCGPVNGRQKPIAYQGPEQVLDFLKRTGALLPGCSDLQDVAIVRPQVAKANRPEVYRIDIEAIVLDNDPTTNIVVLPGDQVYVGETRRSSFSRVLPAWLRPFYRKLVGLLPPDPALWWSWAR